MESIPPLPSPPSNNVVFFLHIRLPRPRHLHIELGTGYQGVIASVVYELTAAAASTGRQLLAGYWGQNSAVGQKIDNEKPLKEVCQTTKYDILNVAFLDGFFDSRNKGKIND